MGWEASGAAQFMLYGGALVAAVVLTLIVTRLTRRLWLGTMIGMPAPPAAILAYFLWLELQQPVGPYYAVVGFIYLPLSLLFSFLGAGVAAFLLSGRD